jgi:cytochrome c2
MAKKIGLCILILLVIAIAGVIGYIKFTLPDVGKSEERNIVSTMARIERGRYLANHVSVCMDCHSTRDWTKFSGPLVEGTLGKGGEIFDQKFGFPGTFYSKNITPSGIGEWTDGEILRAITTGVSRNGKPLFPVMPYHRYGMMDKEDIFSIVTYIRTLRPIENKVPKSEPSFPMSVIIHTIPRKAMFSKIPNKLDRVSYGAYLFNAAACAECHTKQDKGKPIEGMELAGGFEFPLPSGGVVRSPNITQDIETGIGSWTEEVFVNRFKSYASKDYAPQSIENGTFNTVMPWTMYAGMTEEDLQAMYAYLKTVKPISNSVVKFSEK